MAVTATDSVSNTGTDSSTGELRIDTTLNVTVICIDDERQYTRPERHGGRRDGDDFGPRERDDLSGLEQRQWHVDAGEQYH